MKDHKAQCVYLTLANVISHQAASLRHPWVYHLRPNSTTSNSLWICWTTSRTTSCTTCWHVRMLWICCRLLIWYGLVSYNLLWICRTVCCKSTQWNKSTINRSKYTPCPEKKPTFLPLITLKNNQFITSWHTLSRWYVLLKTCKICFHNFLLIST